MGSMMPPIGTALYMSMNLRLGGIFWNDCSFMEAKFSLTGRGVMRPLWVLGGGSGCSPGPPSYPPVGDNAPHPGSSGSGVLSVVEAVRSSLNFSRSYDS